MAAPRRYPQLPPKLDLIAAREKRYPHVTGDAFATMLGITRLHMISVERGRRTPSADLVLRWLALLAPDATLEMFGDLPLVEKRLSILKRLQKVAPKTFAA
jgi:transcriptional regulator with XRE-family HTH domain